MDYALSPEYKFPVAINEAQAVIEDSFAYVGLVEDLDRSGDEVRRVLNVTRRPGPLGGARHGSRRKETKDHAVLAEIRARNAVDLALVAWLRERNVRAFSGAAPVKRELPALTLGAAEAQALEASMERLKHAPAVCGVILNAIGKDRHFVASEALARHLVTMPFPKETAWCARGVGQYRTC